MKTAKRKTVPAPGSEAPQASGRKWWVIGGWLLALLVLFEVYAPSMNGPFVFDDAYLPFQEDALFAKRTLPEVMRYQRPLMNLSFWLNGKVADPQPRHYHVVNVWLHFINGVLMFVTVRKLLSMSGTGGRDGEMLAAFAAGVFLLHPLQTESVAYVAGRSESFSLIWFLASFAMFLHWRGTGISWGAVLGVIACFGAALLSKEHTAVLPALFVLTDIHFREASIADSLKRNWKLYGPLLLMGAAGAVFVWRVLASADTAGFGMKDLPWHHYFFTQWRAIWVYLRLFALPAGLNADYDFAISRSPMDHGALVALLALVALVGLAWRYRERYPLAFYGLLVFLLLLTPTSSIVPIKDAVAERRIYLPMIGLLLVVCDLARRWKPGPVVQGGAMAAVLLVLAVLTYGRSAVWASPIRLWEDTVRQSPHNARAHFHQAMALYEAGRCQDALPAFEAAEKNGNREHRLYVDWGLAYDCLSNTDEALKKFRRAAEIENTGHGRSLIGMALAKQNQLGAALEELNQAAKLDPGYDMTYVYRGNVQLMLEALDKAESDYQKALSLNPDNDAARKGLASLAKRRGTAR